MGNVKGFFGRKYDSVSAYMKSPINNARKFLANTLSKKKYYVPAVLIVAALSFLPTTLLYPGLFQSKLEKTIQAIQTTDPNLPSSELEYNSCTSSGSPELLEYKKN